MSKYLVSALLEHHNFVVADSTDEAKEKFTEYWEDGKYKVNSIYQVEKIEE